MFNNQYNHYTKIGLSVYILYTLCIETYRIYIKYVCKVILNLDPNKNVKARWYDSFKKNYNQIAIKGNMIGKTRE